MSHDMVSARVLGGCLVILSLLLVCAGCQESYSTHAGDLPNRTDRTSQAEAVSAGDTGRSMKTDDNLTDNGENSNPTSPIESSAPASMDSRSISSSAAGSHKVRGGHYPSQPLNFPADINKGPGWKVPEGPYRPLPPPPPESSTKKAPE